MAVVTDEEERSAFGHVDLHANEAVGMAWKMVKGYALTEVQSSLIEGLPISVRCQRDR